MVFQKTTFEGLFSAALSGTGLLAETSFGFESGGKRHFNITVPGRPRIEKGMTVIALLEKPNEWGSRGLLGWVDCIDDTLVCDSPGKLFGIALLSAFFASMFPIRAYAVFNSSENADMIAVFVAALFSASALRFLYLSAKALMVRRALGAIRNFSRASNSAHTAIRQRVT